MEFYKEVFRISLVRQHSPEIASRWLGANNSYKRIVDLIVHLVYPLYFLYIIGVWKILGVRYAGISAMLKVRTRNKQIGNRKVKHLEIPHYV